jgi:hypothetical protein
MSRILLTAAVLAFCSITTPVAAQLEIDVNRPRSEFECDLPNGIRWYGSKQRCLQELCADKNVTNEWTFDSNGKRRRRNPCYRIDPFNFGG